MQILQEQKSAVLPTVLKTKPEQPFFGIHLSYIHSHNR